MLPNDINKMMRDIEKMTEGPMAALSKAFEERQRILNGPASEIARYIQEANRIRTAHEKSLLGVLAHIPVMPQGISELLEHTNGAFRHSEIQNVLRIYKGYIEQTESFFQKIQPQLAHDTLAACKAIQEANKIVTLFATLKNQCLNTDEEDWDLDEDEAEGFTSSIIQALKDFVSDSVLFLSKSDRRLYANIVQLLKKAKGQFPLISCILVLYVIPFTCKIIAASISSYFIESQPSVQSQIPSINISIFKEERFKAERQFGVSIDSVAVTKTNVKVFASQRKQAAQVAVLEKGHVVCRLEKTGKWVLVEFKVDGDKVMRGYVRSKYLKKI